VPPIIINGKHEKRDILSHPTQLYKILNFMSWEHREVICRMQEILVLLP
jgi:hypothetical protein